MAWSTRVALSAVATLAVVGADPHPAEACGGFFCSQQQPVLQTAERIVFVKRDDGRHTAVVQIQYSGPAERFSWVVPVPGVPEIGVSSDVVFQRLDARTRPRFNLRTVIEGECAAVQSSGNFNNGNVVDGGVASADAGAPPDPGVSVVAAGAVGPYDYEVIQVDPALADPAAAAVRWLDDNGYDVTAIGPDLLRDYLSARMNLVAFRLQKRRDTGDIRPVTMTYDAERPMIPIKLTAVAAEADMGILTWVATDDRAAPVNYRTLELNYARYDWLRGGTVAYDDLVSAAADEAGGQGFVTEYAGGTEVVEGRLFFSSEARAWDALTSESWAGREVDLVLTLLRNFGGWDGVSEVVEAQVPLPTDVTVPQFLGCPLCFLPGDGQGPLEGVDAAALLVAFEELVVEPVRSTQAILTERPYLTRLYTTLSAQEMTVDPVFDVNNGLADVSNVHSATRYIECSASVDVRDAPWRLELETGEVVRGRGGAWPDGTGTLPANRRVTQLAAAGEGEVVADNAAAITEALAALAAGRESSPSGRAAGGEGDGCRSTSASDALWLAVLAAVLVGRRRRRT